MKKLYVILIILAIILTILAFDAYLYSDSLEGNSITQIIRWAASYSALVPWLVGFGMGYLTSHFFEGIGKRFPKYNKIKQEYENGGE